MATIDPVPLGVSGSVTIPFDQYVARTGHRPDRAALLLEDDERLAYLAKRLADAIDRPLTSPGSQRVARQVLDYFAAVDLMPHFATKALETLRDGNRHDRLVVSPQQPRLAVAFVAWNGTHREVQAERVGHYLDNLVAPGQVLAKQGVRITGLLEIDAFVRDNADPERPALPLDEVFEVDLEYSYVPGFLLGSPDEEGPLQPMLLVNPDLCTPDELQDLRKLLQALGKFDL